MRYTSLLSHSDAYNDDGVFNKSNFSTHPYFLRVGFFLLKNLEL